MNNGSDIKDLEKISLQDKIELLKKEIDLIRDDAQVEILRRDSQIQRLENINKEHQDINGKLRLEISRLKGGM